jgi:hypothetical protein
MARLWISGRVTSLTAMLPYQPSWLAIRLWRMTGADVGTPGFEATYSKRARAKGAAGLLRQVPGWSGRHPHGRWRDHEDLGW